MPRRRHNLAAPPTTDWRWTRGWFAEVAATHDDYPSHGPTPDDIRQAELEAAVDRALATLDPKQAEVARLYLMTDNSLDEVAEVLGDITRQGVHYRARQAAEALRAALAQQLGVSADTGGIEEDDNVGRNKDQGTGGEMFIVNQALERGLDASRAPNGLPSRDVDIRLQDGRAVVVESKVRQALSLHPTLQGVVDHWGETGVPAVVWHRLIKKPGNKRRTAAGPRLAALPLDNFLDLLAEIDDAHRRIEELTQQVHTLNAHIAQEAIQ